MEEVKVALGVREGEEGSLKEEEQVREDISDFL